MNAIGAGWDLLLNGMQAIWGVTVVPLWNLVGPPMKAGMEVIKAFWNVLVSGMKLVWDNTLGALWDAMGPGIMQGMDNLKIVWDAVVDAMAWAWDNVLSPIWEAFEYALDLVYDAIKPIVKAIEKVMDAGGAIIDAGLDMIGYADGGIATGPESGYPVMLHGTEAVVPLPDGRSIPVEMKGGQGMGGGGNTYNITINPSGMTDRTDKREFARKMSNAIQQEIARASGGSTMRSGR